MAQSKMALVKLDPPETYSTGGTVERIILKDDELETLATARGETYQYAQEQIDQPDVYKLIACGDTVQVGWIYTDKTNLFVDSNLQA